MKILYCHQGAELGGAERSLWDLLRAVRAGDPSLECRVLLTADGPLAKEIRALGIPVKIMPLPTQIACLGDSQLGFSRNPWVALGLMGRLLAALAVLGGYLKQLRQEVEAQGPDRIHSNSLKFHLLLGLLRPPPPLIWHIRDFIGPRAVMSRLLRWCAPPGTQAIAISQAIAQDIQQTLPGVPVTVIYDAIDTAAFVQGASSRQPHSPLQIGLVATYARWKGQDIFLRAIAQLLPRLQGAQEPIPQFYIIGGPIYQTPGSQFSRLELEQLANQLGIQASLKFIDFQTDIVAIYRRLDIVVHASTRPEPFGRTIAEGMASGCCVVVAQAGGAAELFTPGVDALGVVPCHPAALADALWALIQQPKLRQTLATQAQQTAQAKFSYERFATQLLQVYGHF